MLNEYALQSIARERLTQLHEAAAHATKVAEAHVPLRVRLGAWMIRTGRTLLRDVPRRPTLAVKPSRSCP